MLDLFGKFQIMCTLEVELQLFDLYLEACVWSPLLRTKDSDPLLIDNTLNFIANVKAGLYLKRFTLYAS